MLAPPVPCRVAQGGAQRAPTPSMAPKFPRTFGQIVDPAKRNPRRDLFFCDTGCPWVGIRPLGRSTQGTSLGNPWTTLGGASHMREHTPESRPDRPPLCASAQSTWGAPLGGELRAGGARPEGTKHSRSGAVVSFQDSAAEIHENRVMFF